MSDNLRAALEVISAAGWLVHSLRQIKQDGEWLWECELYPGLFGILGERDTIIMDTAERELPLVRCVDPDPVKACSLASLKATGSIYHGLTLRLAAALRENADAR